MAKRDPNEPDDKAWQRLRQFEDERKPVPDKPGNEDNRKKEKLTKKKKDQEENGNHPDNATDE